MTDMRPILDAIGTLPDAEIDLADAALQLARVDAPTADWQAARDHLSEMARNIAGTAEDAEDLPSRAAMLSDLLCDHYDYRGDIDTYDDPANANLLRVIERRRGMPVALGILWLHAATAAGWQAYGLDLPGHFVIALAEGTKRLVLDVFDGGTPLDDRAARRLVRRAFGAKADATTQGMTPMTNRAVLLRLQSNIRLRRIQAGDLDGALACTEETLRIAPDTASLWREAANLQERLDRVAAALHSYERFLALSPAGPAAERVRAAMDDLRTRLN
jgi:regulator of sirC expression with transglutaminase-like and TPR domain